ncbi:MAG: hypothetical protein ICV80_07545 [Microcoleus sp. T1-bin1]|nr:hypothetical protein [Microcoleus sp. T1-bin1]
MGLSESGPSYCCMILEKWYKIYRVEEGTTADDLFIVDEKANKWAVEDVSEATMGATTNSVAQIVSGNGRVGAPIQKF